MINTILIIGILIILIVGLYFGFFKGRNKHYQYEVEEDQYDIDYLINSVKETFNNVLKSNLYVQNLSKEEFDKRMYNRKKLRKALKNCSYGDLRSKNYVKSSIRDILVNRFGIKENNINKVINFDHIKGLSATDQFDILLMLYKKNYGYEALGQLIEAHGLDQLKEQEGESGYCITSEEVEQIFYEEGRKALNFEDKLEIVVQRIYQRYKGYSVVDEIRDMKIDGISGGVSGIPATFYEDIDMQNSGKQLAKLPYSHDGIWIFYKGKMIHLKFLSFGTEKELIRVCKNIYRFNNPGQLSAHNGYKVNEMKDGARVVVARPPFAESWVFFVRKFDSIKKAHVEDLIVDDNNQLPIEMIKWLIKGRRVTAITGSQGSGKTTLLMSIIQYIAPSLTLRIQEMSFELHLRKLYPHRNIVTFKETDTISGQEALDLQKKTDGSVTILGEVASASVASMMIELTQVSALFTLFTHHAKTSENLILALRNNLLQTRVFNNEKVAEQQVAEVINYDIHLSKAVDGHRYIERITEIIPLTVFREYPKNYRRKGEFEEKVEGFMETMTTYFERMTDRKTFETRDVIVCEEGSYKCVHPPSKESLKQIKKFLGKDERDRLKGFISNNFGEYAYDGE